ncbi:ankyrin repeat domain-containing protein [Burkholderia vietnamiensis]|uniref:ankyrin repeat domain-containing protein n=1 Tax=Burkholderia vietnamiensis TaxID=60552 RepID=UPI001CF52F02|nr:ankyrin repeat domain-containing protein [Burkholderia vietnamiensis]MCA8448948.1 ankyrin repeat domain-containing protein [Burkholderia vietnamiensis]
MSTAANDPATVQAVTQMIVTAVMENDVASVQLALDKGLNIQSIQGPVGMSLLHIAAGCGAADVVNILLSIGMNPLAQNGNGITPVQLAQHEGHAGIAATLMAAAGHEQTIQSAFPSAGARLMHAANEGDLPTVKTLVNDGTLVGLADEDGTTPLHLAAAGGHMDVVEFLIDQGADLLAKSVQNGRGWTALDIAVRRKHEDVALLLLQAMGEQGFVNANGEIVEPAAQAPSEPHSPTIVPSPAAQQAQAPAEPTQASASPSGEPRVLDLSERHLWGTPVDDLYGYWKPGQSRTMARLRKTFGGAKAAPEQGAPTASTPAPNAVAPTPTPTQANGTSVPISPEQAAFKTAILNGDVEAIQTQVAAGFPINDQAFAGSAALHVAAADGKTHVVRALLSLGADLNAPDQQGNTALLYAIGNRRTEAAIHLARTDGVDVDHKTPGGFTALHAAVQANVPLVVPYLLAQGADTTLKNRDGQTALQFAEAVKRDDIVAALRNAPAPVKDHSGEDDSEGGVTQEQFERHTVNAAMPGIVKAVMDNKVEDVELALEKGLNIHEMEAASNGMTLLHIAAGCGAKDVTRVLLAAGMDPLVRNNDGVTPLDLARHEGYAVVESMLENALPPYVQAVLANDVSNMRTILGKGLNIQDLHGANHMTLLHLAAEQGHHEMTKLLIEAGLDPLDETRDGLTASVIADMAGHAALAKYLRDVGANPNELVTIQGADYTALEIANARRASKASEACENGDLVGVRSVVTGPDDPVLTMTNTDGASLLHAAVAGENADVVRFLVELGIDLQTRMTQHIDELDTDGPFTALDLARILRNKAAVAVLEEACDAAKGGKGIDGETPMVKAMRKPDGGLFVGVYNKFTGEKVHRTMAERLEKQVLEQHEAQEQGDAPANSSPSTEAEMDAMRAIGAAIEAGDTDRLEQVIDGYPTGQQIFVGDGNTILHIAANRGNAANVLLLLAKGADPFHRNQRGQRAIDVVPDNFHGKHTALHLALAMGEEHRFPFPAMVPTFRDEAIERGVSFENLQVLKAQSEAVERLDRMEQDPYWTMNVLEPRRLDIARGAAKAMNYDVSMFDLKKSDTQLHFITLLVAAAEWLAKAGRQEVDNDRDFRETATVDQVTARRVAFRRAVAGVQVRLAMHPYSFAISTQTPENREMFSKLCNFIANVDRADTMSELEQHDFTAAISILMSSWDWSQVHLLAQARAVAKGEVPPHLTLEDFRRFHENFEALDSTKHGDNIYPRDANEDAYMTLSTMLGLLVQHKSAVRPLAVTDDLPDVEALRETKNWLSEIRAFREVYELTGSSEFEPALKTSDIDFNEAMGLVAGGGVAILYEVFTFLGDEPMVMLFRGRLEEHKADWFGGVVMAANRAELQIGMAFVPIV